MPLKKICYKEDREDLADAISSLRYARERLNLIGAHDLADEVTLLIRDVCPLFTGASQSNLSRYDDTAMNKDREDSCDR